MSDQIMTPNPHRERKQLGPSQLAWLAKHVPAFKFAKRVADRVQAESERSKAKHGENHE